VNPEILFIKYAFPCAFILHERGEISPDDLSRLEDSALKEKILPRPFLEKIFHRAFKRIGKLAREMGKDPWDITVIRAYFVTRHNEIISEGMEAYANAPPSLRELCKVHESTIQSIHGDSVVVQYNGKKIRPVSAAMIPNPRVGEKVTIHYGYAVERITGKD
jgi:hypothetical protein